MEIGIEEHSNLVYEGRDNQMGFGIWPNPIILQVAIHSAETPKLQPPRPYELLPYTFVFREDTYNTANRVRRGRLYRAGESQPLQWSVMPHPAIPAEQRQLGSAGTLRKRLYTFSSVRLRQYLESQKLDRPVFVLGSDHGFTIWALVTVETSATGDELITLKARQQIDAFPTLDRSKILEVRNGGRVLEYIDKFQADIGSAGPESVIDRAREAATAICSTYLQVSYDTEKGKDLGTLADALQKEELGIAGNLASILARLHSRGKHAQRETREMPPIQEQDAQLAIHAVATILREIGWAAW